MLHTHPQRTYKAQYMHLWQSFSLCPMHWFIQSAAQYAGNANFTTDGYHGAQSDVGNRERWHENKAVCEKSGGKNHYGIWKIAEFNVFR